MALRVGLPVVFFFFLGGVRFGFEFEWNFGSGLGEGGFFDVSLVLVRG